MPWVTTDLSSEMGPVLDELGIKRFDWMMDRPFVTCGFASKDCKGKWFLYFNIAPDAREVEIKVFLMLTKAKYVNLFELEAPLRSHRGKIQVLRKSKAKTK